MLHSEFWSLVDEVLTAPLGRSLAADQVLGELDGRTAVQALDDGVDPREVWHALADALEIPDPQRWGSQRQAPPRRR